MKKETRFLKMMSEKASLRKELLMKRRQISLQRRKEAELKLFSSLSFEDHSYVLSFVSLPDEIDITLINQVLVEKNKLVLPKVKDENLLLYQVQSLKDLQFTGKLWEPDPQKCSLFPLEKIALACVPGVGFDETNMRLGFGKGHYDRLLKNMRGKKIGVGFLEQLVPLLPKEPHDEKLDELILV